MNPDARRSRRILVVDDNLDGLESMSRLLQVMGNEVRTATNGQEAIDLAEAFAPDIVMLDIGLPKLDGYEAGRRIRTGAHGRDVLLVAVTGWGREEDRQRSLEAGFDHHWVKPIDLKLLQQLLS